MNVGKFIEAAAVTIMAALFSWNVRAEEPDPSLRFEVRLGATPPQCSMFSTTRLVHGWGWCGGDTGISEDYKISSAVGTYDGDVYATGAFTAEFSYVFRKWLTFSVGLGYNHYWKDQLSRLDDSRIGTAHAGAMYLMPLARFTYMAHKNVKLYSGAGLGFSMFKNYSADKFPECSFADVRREPVFRPMMQLVPFGVTFGNRFFGFAETGFGAVWIGVHGGVGYRF